MSADADYTNCGLVTLEAITAVTDTLVVRGEHPYLDVGTSSSPHGETRVWLMPDAHDGTFMISIPAGTDETSSLTPLYAEIDAQPGDHFRVEVETPPGVLNCQLVVHGASPAQSFEGNDEH